MNRTEKETFITEFQELLGRAPVFYLTDFTGLDVKSLSKLRQSLRDSGAEYVVAKNRLVRLALKESELPDLGDALTGPTGFVFGFDDAVGPAKVLTDFAKENKDRPALKLGVVDRKVIQPEQIIQPVEAGLPVRCYWLSWRVRSRLRWMPWPVRSRPSFRRWWVFWRHSRTSAEARRSRRLLTVHNTSPPAVAG